MSNNTVIPAVLQTIDDNNSAFVGEYQPPQAWTIISGDPQDFDSTSHTTSTVGSSFIFSFNGTFVNVLGTLDGSGGSSIYTLDDGTPITFIHPTTHEYQVSFYNSGSLSHGQHRLNITNASYKGSLRLDFFQITSDFSTVVSPPAVTPTGSANDPIATTLFTNHKSPSTGTIAGIVIGVILLLVASILGIFLVRRRMRLKQLPPAPAEKGLDILEGDEENNAESRKPSRFLFIKPRLVAPTQPSSQATSSAMFTSVIMISPVRSGSEISGDRWGAPSSRRDRR